MIQRIGQLIQKNRDSIVAASGLALLGFYLFYARKQVTGQIQNQREQHRLKYSLKDLLAQQKNKRFKKIAITESSKNKANFTGDVLSRVKADLIAHEVTTLINCSPIKTLSAGSQCFIESLSDLDVDDQKQYISFYQNAARCELLIEKTFIDIEQIRKEDKLVAILCDTNTMDLKVRADLKIWNKFLADFHIDQQKLMSNYDIVIHLQDIDQDNQEATRQNVRIEQTWKGYQNYYTYHYSHQKTYQQNAKIAVDYIKGILRPVIPQLNSQIRKKQPSSIGR